MSYVIKYDDITNVFLYTEPFLSKTGESMAAIVGHVGDIIGMASFKGVLADNIKAYFSEVHNTILYCLGEIICEYRTRLLLYKDGYHATIDDSLHAVLTEDTLSELAEYFPSHKDTYACEHERLNNALNSVSDIISLAVPSPNNVTEQYDMLFDRVSELRYNVGEYEREHNGDFDNLRKMLDSLKAFMNESRPDNIYDYQAGSIAKLSSAQSLVNTYMAAGEVRQGLAENVSGALNREKTRMDTLIEEWADKREKEGIKTMVLGGLAVVGGVLAIVFTAGAAAPVVAPIVYTASAGMIAYGASNMWQGYEDYQLGKAGDPFSVALNPLRDTVFTWAFGKDNAQGAYDIFGFACMITTAVAAPINAGIHSAAAAGTSVAQSVGYSLGSAALSYGVGWGAGELGTYFGNQWVGEDWGWIVGTVSGISAGVATNYGARVLDGRFNFSGTRATPQRPGEQTISESSAKETNQWWKDARDYDDPYKPLSRTKEIVVTNKDGHYVRVYDGDNSGKLGGWIMSADDIEGLTPQQIQQKFALPQVPKYICDVDVPEGTHLRTGIVGSQRQYNFASGGGIQYDTMGSRLDPSVFINEMPLVP